MAIAFARVSIHTRSKGHSAIAAASYRSGTRLYDERTGISHDFTKRHDVIYSEILLPEGADPAFLNREYLWNQAEASEKRKDAQVCKDVVLALPKELNRDMQIELTKRFVNTHFIQNGLPADISIHDHGDGNPHAHILVPTRRLEKNHFSKYKARDLNPAFARGKVIEADYWGDVWRDAQNAFFEEKNLDISVDLNHVIPERHEGSGSEYLAQENNIIREAREEFVLDSTEKIVEYLSEKYSVFSRREVENLLFKFLAKNEKTEEYLQKVEAVFADKNIIHLGLNDSKKDCYTTRNQYMQEARLRKDIEQMMGSRNHILAGNIDALANKNTLSDEQKEALVFIADSPDIAVVIGRPGTGKSHLLKPVKEYFESGNCEVMGAALSGKVAKALQNDTGIPSSTIASLAWKLDNDRLRLTNKHILVIDEAGMVDFNNMSKLVSAARKAGSKIVLVGDSDQLKPINKGEIFRGIAAITGYVELENIRRQNDLGDRKASLAMAKGDIASALEHYQKKDAIILSDTPMNAMESVVKNWQKDITEKTLKSSIMLAFTKKAVAELNIQARDALQEKNILAKENIELQGHERKLHISTGERLLFRQNDKNIGVRNGDLGTVLSVSQHEFSIKLDSGEELKISKEYKALDYGYALTVHKSQGMTVENCHVCVDSKYWDRNLSFVAMTRHRENLKVYADKINHPDLQALKKTLSRSVTRDNVIDFPLDLGIRKGFSSDNLVKKAVNFIAGTKNPIKNQTNWLVNYESNLADSRKNARQKATSQDGLQQKTFHDVLKKKYPLLAEYEDLHNKSIRMNGYFREKMEKRVQELEKVMLKDKNLVRNIQAVMPEMAKRLFATRILEKSSVRER